MAGALYMLTMQYVRAANTDQPEGALPAAQRPQTAVSAAPSQPPRRLVLVVIDGLRLDVAQQMPQLQALGERGHFAKASAPLPSLSRVSYTAMVAGANPERTGIRNNSFNSPVGVDTVLQRAKDAGLKVSGVGDLAYWEENFEPSLDAWTTVDDTKGSEALQSAALALLKRQTEGIAIIHMLAVDRAGHAHGVTEPYHKAAAELDAIVGQVGKALDLDKDALMIVADHGHVDRGGHGGDEPEVLAIPAVLVGYGFGKGAQDFGPISALGPTVSLLMGLEYPRDMTTAPAYHVLDPALYPEKDQEARRQEWMSHRRQYETRWLKGVYEDWTSVRWSGEEVGNRVSSATVTPHDATLERLLEARATTLDEIQRDRRVGRTPMVALLIVPQVLLMVLGLIQGFRMAPLFLSPLTLLGVMGVYWSMGWPLSFSAISSKLNFVLMLGALTVGVLSAHGGALWWMLRELKGEQRAAAWRFHATVVALLTASAAPFYWLLAGFAVDAPQPALWVWFAPIVLGAAGTAALTLVGLVWFGAALFGGKGAQATATEPSDTAGAEAPGASA